MSARAQSLGAPALPQVNLLPPEVTAARGLARIKRWLLFVVLAAILAAVGIVALAMIAEQDAQAELDRAEERAAELMAEQEQYAEVPLVLSAVDLAEQARRNGMSTEVLWLPYLRAIAATLPDGVRLETFQMLGATPMVLPTEPQGALAAPSVATITFTAQSETVPDTEQWLIDLATVPGFADAWFTTKTITERDDVEFYDVVATVQVNEQAYALRFAETDEESEE